MRALRSLRRNEQHEAALCRSLTALAGGEVTFVPSEAMPVW